MTKGIFDQQANIDSQAHKPTIEKLAPKESIAPQGVMAEKEEIVLTPKNKDEAAIQEAMESVNSTSGNNSMVTDEEQAMLEITDEDEELAEQMLFKGFAKKDIVIPMFRKKGTFITVTTLSPQDMTVVNQVIYDMIREGEDEDGKMEIPQIEITTTKNAYTMALSYVGLNNTDICDDIPTAKLTSLKLAIKKYNELASIGDIQKADSLYNDLKNKLKIRVARFREIPTVIVDFISEEKYKFESRMYAIMSQEAIIPKS
jgi:hypothetical protein